MDVGIRKTSGAAGSDVKPKGKIRPKARRPDEAGEKAPMPSRRIIVVPGKKAVALPRRVWAVGGAVFLVIGIAWYMLSPERREAPPTSSPSGTPGAGGTLASHPPASAASPETNIPEQGLAFIRAVRLQPPQATRLDTLKAEVEAASNAPERLVYTYRWRVNDRVIEDASGDTLNLSPFKKRDLITVTVTPYDGDTAGFAVESPSVAIYSVPPSLELKALRKARKTGEPIELQLVSVAPDGEPVAFSLEAPHVSGMTIDKRSGKISWLLQPGQKGSFRFGAAVEDDNGTKITKIFDITAD
ncbi:MAG: hypothetical protein ACYC5X_00210 [Syntrophales bacterium]